MNTYAVKKINLGNTTDITSYLEEVEKAEVKYCKGLSEVWQYCGCKLRKERTGYSGIVGNIEYIAVRA